MSELNSSPPLDPEIEAALKEQKTGKIAEATARCKKILELNPNHDEALHLMGVIAYQQKNYSEALTHFRKAIDIEAKAHYYNNMGNLYNDLGQLKLAQKMYQAGLRLQPDFNSIRTNLGNVFVKLNQMEEAIFQFQAILREESNHSEALMNLGNLFTSMQRYEQAQDYFQKVLQIKKKPEVLNNLGAIQKHLGTPEKALAYYREAASLAPKSTEILYNLAHALLRQNKNQEAIPILEQIIAIAPNHESALYQLGIRYYKEKALKKASALLARVLEINPAHVQVHLLLGDINFLSGDLSLALTHYQLYSKAQPKDHTVRYNLAVVYEKMGQLDTACIHIHQALLLQAEKA